MERKFIFVTGGVVSGLGKGVSAASLGLLLKQRGLKVAAQKLDPHRIPPLPHPALPDGKAHADASKREHAPVRKAAEHHFKSVVEAASHDPQEQVFTAYLPCFFHKKTPPLYRYSCIV